MVKSLPVEAATLAEMKADLTDAERTKIASRLDAQDVQGLAAWEIAAKLLQPDESYPKRRVAVDPGALRAGLDGAGLTEWFRLLSRQVVALDDPAAAGVIAAMQVIEAIAPGAPRILPDARVWDALETAHAALPGKVRGDHDLAPVLEVGMEHPSWAAANDVPAEKLTPGEIGLLEVTKR